MRDLKIALTDNSLCQQAQKLLTKKYIQIGYKNESCFIYTDTVRITDPGFALSTLQELGNILNKKSHLTFHKQTPIDKSNKAKLIFIAYAAQKVHDTVNAKMGWYSRLCDWVISFVKETDKSKIDKEYQKVISHCQQLYDDRTAKAYQFLSGITS